MMVQQQYELMNGELLPLMREAGVAPVSMRELNEVQRSTLELFFAQQVAPLLSPIAIEEENPPVSTMIVATTAITASVPRIIGIL